MKKKFTTLVLLSWILGILLGILFVGWWLLWIGSEEQSDEIEWRTADVGQSRRTWRPWNEAELPVYAAEGDDLREASLFMVPTSSDIFVQIDQMTLMLAMADALGDVLALPPVFNRARRSFEPFSTYFSPDELQRDGGPSVLPWDVALEQCGGPSSVAVLSLSEDSEAHDLAERLGGVRYVQVASVAGASARAAPSSWQWLKDMRASLPRCLALAGVDRLMREFPLFGPRVGGFYLGWKPENSNLYRDMRARFLLSEPLFEEAKRRYRNAKDKPDLGLVYPPKSCPLPDRCTDRAWCPALLAKWNLPNPSYLCPRSSHVARCVQLWANPSAPASTLKKVWAVAADASLLPRTSLLESEGILVVNHAKSASLDETRGRTLPGHRSSDLLMGETARLLLDKEILLSTPVFVGHMAEPMAVAVFVERTLRAGMGEDVGPSLRYGECHLPSHLSHYGVVRWDASNGDDMASQQWMSRAESAREEGPPLEAYSAEDVGVWCAEAAASKDFPLSVCSSLPDLPGRYIRFLSPDEVLPQDVLRSLSSSSLHNFRAAFANLLAFGSSDPRSHSSFLHDVPAWWSSL